MNTDELALWALLGTALGLVIALVALLVAVLDWHQVGREEPWNLTKVRDDIWVLERVHRSRALIYALHNHGGDRVKVLNRAGMPVQHFRRGSKQVLRIAPELGTNLTIFYRTYPLPTRAWDRLRGHARRDHIDTWNSPQATEGKRTWETPLY